MRKGAFPAFVVALAIGVVPFAALADRPVRIEGDRFSRLVTFTGPTFGKGSFFGASRSWHLRSWVDSRTTLAQHQLYVDIDYVDGRRDYWHAANDDAQDMPLTKLSFEKLSRRCSGLCAYIETVGIDLPEVLLEAKAESGFQIKLYARSGDAMILDISREEISAQLEAIRTYRNQPSAESSVAPAPPSFGADFGTSRPMWGLPGGALVASIRGGSVAALSGLHWADVIIEWDGRKVDSATDIKNWLLLAKPGSRISYKALRGRRTHDLLASF